MALTAYRDTEVSMHRSFEDIERLYVKYGVRGPSPMHIPDGGDSGRIIVFFQRPGKEGVMLSFKIELCYQARRERGNNGRLRNVGTTKEQIARLLFYTLKAKFELIAATEGLVSVEEEFLSALLVDQYTTLYQALQPRLQSLTRDEVPQVFPLALGYQG